MNTLEAALRYVRGGWRVFPVHTVGITDGGEVWCSCGRPTCTDQGKHPRTEHGVKDASSDEAVISKWWTDWPSANIGLATGTQSGVVAVDVDPRHGGDVTLTALEAEHGSLPPTLTSYTGGGGRHLLFRPSATRLSNQVTKDAEGNVLGVDLRADDGYIVLPPSRHKSGQQYAWAPGQSPDELEPAEMPAWLVAWLTKHQTPRTTEGAGPNVELGPLLEGARNDTLFRLASAMRRHATRDEILAALQVVNQQRCQPPLDDTELTRIANSAARYDPVSVAQRSDVVLVPSLQVWTWRQIVDDPLPPPRMLVESLFLNEHIAVLGGPSYSGKSAMALGIAVAVASGQRVFGYFDVPHPVSVVYVFGEQGAALWQLRVRKTAKALGIDDARDLPLILAAGYEHDLSQPQHQKRIIDLIHDTRAGLIFLDPMAVLFRMEDENAPGEAVRAARLPLQRLIRETGVTPVTVHHSTKQARHIEPYTPHDLIRGSGDFSAMTGSVVGVWRKPGSDVTKVLVEGRLDEVHPFRLRPMDDQEANGDILDSRKVVVLRYDGDWDSSDTAPVEPPADKILRAIRARYAITKAPVPWAAIASATGLGKSAIYDNCSLLVARRQLTKTAREGWVPAAGDEEA